MDRGVKIPWVGGVDITWVGGRYTMGRGSIFHRKGGRYTMCRGVKIPWVGGSIYHD